MADRRPRLPDPRARGRALRHRRLALRRADAAGATWVASGRRAVYALAGAARRSRSRSSRSPSCARTSRFARSSRRTRRRRRRPSTRPPRCGPRRRARCCCGSGCCRCGRASCCSSRAGGMRDVAPYATAVLLGFGAFFAALLVFTRVAVRDASRAAPAEGVGPQPAAAPPEHDDPPADAVLGLHAVRDPVRVRDRRAGRAAGRRRVDPLDAPLRARRLAVPRHRDPARRALVATPSSAGAATGPGIRSRTRR